MNANIKSYIKVGLIHFMAYPNTIKGEGADRRDHEAHIGRRLL